MSKRAVCGITERESVKSSQKHSAIKKLEKAGFRVIGTSHGKYPATKIWFVQRGTAI